MIQFSNVVSPSKMQSGEHFSANQYSRLAFDGYSGPVLNIDHFTMSGPTFTAHPHAGFSAVTYLFNDSVGSFINRDSLGNTHELLPGSTHWTRASRGIIHEEMPTENDKPVKGLQIFFNLPEANQLDEPAAFHVSPEKVDIKRLENAIVHRVSVRGTEISGQDALPNAVMITETYLPMQTSFELTIPQNFSGILLVVEGCVGIGHLNIEADHAIGFKTDSPETISLQGLSASNRIVLIAGEHFEQPVFQRGPFMLASQKQLEAAIHRYKRGDFGQLNHSI
ncbi:quercetin 2,3-dioxygenase [Tenacibaculum sp. KUL152]|nr:quercetin 2,3-dioxygenase [Tenacibaculum sp. KUL152]